MSKTTLVKVSLDADEMYPTLYISDRYQPDTDVPQRLVNAINRAYAAVDKAESELLAWLHVRQPDHPIFRHFPQEVSQ